MANLSKIIEKKLARDKHDIEYLDDLVSKICVLAQQGKDGSIEMRDIKERLFARIAEIQRYK